MKREFRQYTCDLCGTKREGASPIVAQMLEVDLAFTDEAGHTQDNFKHVCRECFSLLQRQPKFL